MSIVDRPRATPGMTPRRSPRIDNIAPPRLEREATKRAATHPPAAPAAVRDTTPEPFFKRFLEGQKRAGLAEQTLKHPSDGEDGGAHASESVTKKFPSDGEDAGAGRPDLAMTMKYPSDNEDAAAVQGARAHQPPHEKPNNGGDAPTLKSPSDNEDGGIGGSATPSPVPRSIYVTLKYPSDNEDGGVGL